MSENKVKIIFVMVWSLITGAIVTSILYEPNEQAIGENIAILENVSGTVQVKPDAKILWRDIDQGYIMSFNDKVSTGRNSRASINIKNFKTFTLGPDSLFTIRQPKGDKREILIDLERGFLETKTRPKSSNNRQIVSSPNTKITIRSGQKSYNLSGRGSDIAILKKKIGGEAKVVGAQGDITVRRKGSNSTERVEKIQRYEDVDFYLRDKASRFEVDLPVIPKEIEKVEEPELPLPKKVLPAKIEMPKPRVPEPIEAPKMEFAMISEKSARKYIPSIHSPENGWIAWVKAPIQSVKNSSFTIRLAPPKSRPPKNISWIPIIAGVPQGKLSSLSQGAGIFWKGQSKIKSQKIKLMMSKAETILIERNRPFPEIRLKIRAGAMVKLKQQPQATMVLDESSQTLKIRSLNSIQSGSIRIHFREWDFRKSSRKLIWEKPFIKKTSISLKSIRDFKKISGLMKNGRFSLDRPNRSLSGHGIFLVRDHEIVAKVEGALGSPENLSRLQKRLSCQFIYEGTANAYIGGLQEFRKMERQGKLPKKIYILNSGNFIGINQKFMKDNPSVQRFLNSNTSAFFRSPIKAIGS